MTASPRAVIAGAGITGAVAAVALIRAGGYFPHLPSISFLVAVNPRRE